MAAAGDDPFEEVPVLSCRSCRGEIPGDSAFCPLCGAPVAAPEPEPMFLGDAAEATEVTAMPAEAPPGRHTLIIDATPPPVLEDPAPPPAWSPYGPGPGPMPGPPGAFATPLAPGAPRGIPITPSPLRIVVGVALAGVALWLAAWFVPHAGSEAEIHVTGNLIAAALGIAGLGLIVAGVLHRAQAEVRCRRCSRPVIAWKGAFGLHCPLGPHYARVNWILVAVTVAFWTGVLSVGIATAVWLL